MADCVAEVGFAGRVLGRKVFLDSAEAMALRQPHGGAAALTLWNPYATR